SPQNPFISHNTPISPPNTLYPQTSSISPKSPQNLPISPKPPPKPPHMPPKSPHSHPTPQNPPYLPISPQIISKPAHYTPKPPYPSKVPLISPISSQTHKYPSKSPPKNPYPPKSPPTSHKTPISPQINLKHPHIPPYPPYDPKTTWGEQGSARGGHPKEATSSSLPASALCRGGTTLRPQLRLALDQLSSGDGALGSSSPARSQLWGSALATAAGRRLLSHATVLLPLLQELLAVLQQEGPSTEGIFRRAAGGTELRELREALDCGADVDLGSQPALLLAAILKGHCASLRARGSKGIARGTRGQSHPVASASNSSLLWAVSNSSHTVFPREGSTTLPPPAARDSPELSDSVLAGADSLSLPEPLTLGPPRECNGVGEGGGILEGFGGGSWCLGGVTGVMGELRGLLVSAGGGGARGGECLMVSWGWFLGEILGSWGTVMGCKKGPVGATGVLGGILW
ncbi:unnamed protein product, partial [Bubo scandiacus]